MVDCKARPELSPPWGTTTILLNREVVQGTGKPRHHVYTNQALLYSNSKQSNRNKWKLLNAMIEPKSER
jgi:hypothetical protein